MIFDFLWKKSYEFINYIKYRYIVTNLWNLNFLLIIKNVIDLNKKNRQKFCESNIFSKFNIVYLNNFFIKKYYKRKNEIESIEINRNRLSFRRFFL